MERNKYELLHGVLARKYVDILRDFEEARDDRRVAWNCYQQIIAPCSVCCDTYGGCQEPCPYGCTGEGAHEQKPVTTPPITQEEIDSVMANY